MEQPITKMRIISFGSDFVQIQVLGKSWEQIKINFEEFETIMKRDFPEYWSEYEKSDECSSYMPFCIGYFFRYGKTDEMIKTGQLYTFER